jgi:S-DNA-T family DNA segregation ATPase FtsK/SpoIIIE
MAAHIFGVKQKKQASQKDLFQEQIWSLYTAQVREQSQEHDRLTSHVEVPIIDDTKIMSEILPEVHEPPVYMLPEVPVAPESGAHHERAGVVQKEHERVAQVLEHKLERFGIQGKVVSITHGPSITLFEYQPAVDTKISTIIAREDDLALALQALSLRIIAPIPGKSVVGFEVARAQRTKIVWSDVMRSSSAQNFVGELPLILGVDTVGNELICDLAAAPHILVAGSTGSGKSVCLHTMIMSLLCRKTPDELKIILIDPKRLEFSWYADVAHLLFPVITTTDKAILALRWAVKTMEERYELLAQKGVRTVKELGLPTIVVVIDELADLMMTAGKEVEYLIARLAQMARAAGIHMITATQRPSVDVITGLIKVNFPCRIAFRVMSKIDSRTIIDSAGAEKLLGKGDMLILDAKGSLTRAQGAFVSDSMVKEVVHAIKKQRIPEYEQLNVVDAVQTAEEDALFEAIVSFVLQKDEVSISLLQRAFRIGYNRAARLIDSLEAQGHIMPAQGAKMRKVVK